MKKFVVAALASIGLVSASLIPSAPAKAQSGPAGSVTCEARSEYAFGVWTAYNGEYACRRAMLECAARTPYYGTCYVTRWWFN
jgi:hypothetical protein